MTVRGGSLRPLPDAVDVIVVGAGIMGLATAYHLAKDHTARRILVLDAGYLCGGASGRNGGGVRAQWSSEANVRLMQESLEMCKEFAHEHRINTWFRQGGYLFLARDEHRASELTKSVELQQRLGLETELIDGARARDIVPQLEPSGVVAASFNPNDAVVFPWPFVWGYAEGARALGVDVRTFCRVDAVELAAGRVSGVVTEHGRVRSPIVVNACGAFSPELARSVGVDLPTKPHRHEICASEPLKPFLGPLVADLGSGLYFSQSTRGEIVGGIGNPKTPPGASQASSIRFLALYSRALIATCPGLSSLKIQRQWAGLYDLSPDHAPIVGPVDEAPGFFVASGFMGHGFMMAPAVGKRLARAIATGETPEPFAAWNHRRFKLGTAVAEAMIIG
ncbi:MAG TPA: FAD-binding oxidoreductase [Polyangiaceae bacterium]|nr:FAD-binding oxidoreductase [Polyangiaceae bacterium]